MKKGMIALLLIVLLILGIGAWTIGRYNKMKTLKVNVDGAWSQVQNQYQRRFDLIPNLVETVKGAANFEKETLEGVIEARSKVGQMNINPGDLSDPAKMQSFQAAQDGLSSALSRLMVVVERYPDIKFNQNFQALQAELAGTENRIATERGRYRDAVQAMNQYIVVFPNSMLASIFGIKEVPFFQADDSAETAPAVRF